MMLGWWLWLMLLDDLCFDFKSVNIVEVFVYKVLSV